MAAPISGDGVFSHVALGAGDLAASVRFYDAALAPLGLVNLGPISAGEIAYGRERPALIVLHPADGGTPSGNGVTVGFAAASRAEVDAFHAAGVATGGIDEGPPGARDILPDAYAAYLRDPAGNKICAYTFNNA